MPVDGGIAAELVAAPEDGRVYCALRRPLLGDCAPSGRARLDALAGMLQDVAFLDVDDAGVADLAVWVLRRSRLLVSRFPRFGERLSLRTFCSGLGKMWAERRTTIVDAEAEEPLVEAVALWVHLDPRTWRPVPFSEEEIVTYGAAAAGRRVSARLKHPGPAGEESRTPWHFRVSDCDIAGHVNNAAYWEPLEEDLHAHPGLEQIDAEIEFRTAAQPGEMVVLRNGTRQWIASPGGETHASIHVSDIRIPGR